MINFILNLKLRIKLLLAFSSLLVLTVLLVAFFFFSTKKMEAFTKGNESIDAVKINILQISGVVNYFLFQGYKEDQFQKEGKSPSVEKYKVSTIELQQLMAQLEESGFIQDGKNNLSPLIQTLQQNFDKEITLLKERGFKDFGMEGDLRQAIHAVEKANFPYDKTAMLTLRRHEKDFFLRKDLKYHIEFNAKVDAFITSIAQSKTKEGQQEIIDYLALYRKHFNEIVAIEERIGLDDKSGLKGIIATTLSGLEKEIETLHQAIKKGSDDFKQRTSWLLTILFIVQLGISLLLAIVYSDLITKAIKELNKAMQQLAKGEFPEPLKVRTKEEIGFTKIAFNQLLDRLKAATAFSEALGRGELQSSFDERFQHDVFAKSLLSMRAKLKEANDKQTVINWTNAGMAQLHEIVSSENESIALLGDKIIRLLVKYTGANQGALYVLKGVALHRVSTFAYEKKKFVNQVIEEGQGLVGQCLLERQVIELTQVPKDYVRITSGLGEALPSYLIIVPLIAEDKVLGVFEIASFTRFDPYKVDFLKRISENLASILLNKKNNEETTRLLTEAQERALQLSAQEEEIRQNTEELMAVQEQMAREKNELERELHALRNKLELV